MSKTFIVGALIGVPFGCYMREAGYSQRVNDAYVSLFPSKKEAYIHNKELIKGNQRNKYFDDIKSGHATPEQFEGYVYGGSYKETNKDDKKNELNL